MGQQNYTKFSEYFKKTENNKVITSIENNDEEITTVVSNDAGASTNVQINSDEITATFNKEKIGIVVGCEKLNVRKEADKKSEPLCVINKNEEVKINLTESTTYFYKVQTSSGIEGYCMKEYINVK